MDSQNTQDYIRRVHELITAYNEKNASNTEAEQEEAIELLLEARTLLREALQHDQNNEELGEMYAELVVVLTQYFFMQTLHAEEYTQSLIEPAEFVRRWGGESDELMRVAAAQMSDWKIGSDSVQFLAEAGLPAEAAPFVAFGAVGRLWEVWDFADQVDFARELFADYIHIGSDEAGSPFCLDESNGGIVVLLDQDLGFQAVTFVNSSVQQLAESLLIYKVALIEAERLRAESSETEQEIFEGIAEWVEQEIMRIDSRAMGQECFWRQEVDILRAY